MKRIGLVFGLAAMMVAPASASADQVVGDPQTVLARLEAEASDLRSQMRAGNKMGAMERLQIRNDLDEIARLSRQVRAGERPDRATLARLVDGVRLLDPRDPSQVAEHLADRQARLDQRLVAARKLGMLQRARIRSELDQIDDLISDLEAGETIDLARLDDVVGVPIPAAARPPEERARILEARKATMERYVTGGRKLGALERREIREQIEQLDGLISDLERSF